MSFIPYQVDYSVKNAAKTLGFSKKRVTFKFGFANERAIAEGLSGPACRGSEHELTFVWSLATGKRQLLLDSRDLHFSESGQNGWTADRVWQHAFNLRDTTGKTYRVHFISQPVVKEMPNSRPFDIRISGMSYFDFNPIYKLGTPHMAVGLIQQRHHSGRDSPMSHDERQQLAAAKLASLRDIAEQERKQVERTAQALEAATSKSSTALTTSRATSVLQREEQLISFDDEDFGPAATQNSSSSGNMGMVAPAPPVAAPNNYYASSLTLDTVFAGDSGTNPYGAPNTTAAAATNPYGGPSNAATNFGSSPYGTTSYTTNPYAPPPPVNNSSGGTSYALTPYQGGSGPQAQQQQQQPYVDATGRLSMGQQQPSAYGSSSSMFESYNSNTSGVFNYDNNNNNTNNTNNVLSPSNFSYGSAPSFAQPPSQSATYNAPSSYGYAPTGTTTAAADQAAPAFYAPPPADAFVQPSASVYGGQTSSNDFAQPPNPYGQPSPNPYAQTSNPYATPPAAASAAPQYTSGFPPQPPAAETAVNNSYPTTTQSFNSYY